MNFKAVKAMFEVPAVLSYALHDGHTHEGERYSHEQDFDKDGLNVDVYEDLYFFGRAGTEHQAVGIYRLEQIVYRDEKRPGYYYRAIKGDR